ncbi:MAG: phosphoglucosamine mutase [Alphaproteobacteria bacterium CG_4_9_14_3_um_filter_47_13]|nr:MAG: phosphoglucosamine mutase [Alphaproteobacteria bacterium CG_4_9_14_3_um_filter_47_13]
MNRKFFGTDGIRGKAGAFPMTADMALKVAMATARALDERFPGNHQKRAVIGKDTRLSGYMLEQAMAAGFEAMGMDVIFLGPLPTPAVAMLTRSLRADIGVMISASHNSYEDNGIKLFGADGYKLSDDIEIDIESHIENGNGSQQPAMGRFGKASRLDDAQGRYVEFLKGTFPRRMTLEGLKIVIDCAHGAAYKVAPQVLQELEAHVIVLNNKPDGRNINDHCGATDTASLQQKVIEEKADIGLALDGDADRLIMVDETGDVVNGDQLMALLALTMQNSGTLQGGGLVATIMSNLGLERFLGKAGLTLNRTAVGDRYVVERMREGGFNLGGEQSGHIILSDFSTTGDGMLAALQVLSSLQQRAEKASALLHLFDPLPQILQNVKFHQGVRPLDDEQVKTAIEKAQTLLANDGRLVIRPSGTEPVIRVMAEGDNPELVKKIVNDLCAEIEKAAC